MEQGEGAGFEHGGEWTVGYGQGGSVAFDTNRLGRRRGGDGFPDDQVPGGGFVGIKVSAEIQECPADGAIGPGGHGLDGNRDRVVIGIEEGDVPGAGGCTFRDGDAVGERDAGQETVVDIAERKRGTHGVLP